MKLSEYFGVSADDLLRDDKDPKENIPENESIPDTGLYQKISGKYASVQFGSNIWLENVRLDNDGKIVMTFGPNQNIMKGEDFVRLVRLISLMDNVYHITLKDIVELLESYVKSVYWFTEQATQEGADKLRNETFQEKMKKYEFDVIQKMECQLKEREEKKE